MMSAAQVLEQPEAMWKPKDVAEKLGKSVVWVQRMAAAEKLPHRKIGKDLRFYRHEIEAWINAQPGKQH